FFLCRNDSKRRSRLDGRLLADVVGAHRWRSKWGKRDGVRERASCPGTPAHAALPRLYLCREPRAAARQFLERARAPYAPVPPTVMRSIRRVGWPTPTGTP